MRILKSGEQVVFAIGAKRLGEALGDHKLSVKAEPAYATATDNANSVGVEQIPDDKGGLRILVTGRDHGYGAVTTVMSDKKTGRALIVFGAQFFVPDAESAFKDETMPAGLSLVDFLEESAPEPVEQTTNVDQGASGGIGAAPAAGAKTEAAAKPATEKK